MSLYGIRPNPSTPAPQRPQPARVDQAPIDRPRIDRQPGAGTVGRPQVPAPAAGAQAPQAGVPTQAPAGTDPELWSVLTADERAFFAKAGAMGPLTYNRMMTAKPAAPPMALGGRIDVKA